MMESLLEFAQRIQSTGVATALRTSSYVYPLVLTLHLIGIAFFGGLIFVTNLRLLGLALRKLPASKVIESLRRPKRAGFVIVAGCGILMASAKAEEYYYNWLFWTKMSLLALVAVHGLVFRRSVYRNASDQIPQGKKAAALSLLLWTCVMIAGRGIGYVEPPLERLHALLVR